MNYREIFENLQKEKTKENKTLTQIIQAETQKNHPYKTYEQGGLLSCHEIDSHKKEKTFAFILEHSYSEPNYGVRDSIDFGIIKGKKTYRRGFEIVRGATPWEKDDAYQDYNEIKILSVQNNEITIGLKSHKAIDIYEIDIEKRTNKLLKRYDLEAENLERQKQKLSEEAAQTIDFENRLVLFGKALHKTYNQDLTKNPRFDIFEHEGERIGLISIDTVNRAYDSMLEKIDFYIYTTKEKQPKHIMTREPKYNCDYLAGKRFYSVSARRYFGEITQNGNTLKIPVKLEIIANIGTGQLARIKHLGTDEFELEYKI